MKYLRLFLLLGGQELIISFFALVAAYAKDNPGSLSSNLTTSSSLHHRDDADYQASLSAELIPAYKLSQRDTVRIYGVWSKDFVDERKSKFGDSFLSFKRSLYSSEESMYSLSGEGRIYFPTDKESRKNTSLTGKLYFAPTLKIDLSRPVLTGLTFNLIPYGVRDFHRYNTDRKGKSNSRYTLGNTIQLGYSPIEPLSLSFSFRYARSWTHQGSRRDDTFRFIHEAGYSFPKQVTLSLGHLNEGSALAANGINSNVKIFNKYTSTIYLSVAKSF